MVHDWQRRAIAAHEAEEARKDAQRREERARRQAAICDEIMTFLAALGVPREEMAPAGPTVIVASSICVEKGERVDLALDPSYRGRLLTEQADGRGMDRPGRDIHTLADLGALLHQHAQAAAPSTRA